MYLNLKSIVAKFRDQKVVEEAEVQISLFNLLHVHLDRIVQCSQLAH
jgi:hypothetical protein